MSTRLLRRRIIVVAGAAAVAAGVGIGVGSPFGAPADARSSDSLLQPAVSDADKDGNGVPDAIDALPDMVPVVDSTGERVGFVRKEHVWEMPNAPVRKPFDIGPPVVDSTGELVGYLTPASGFVPRSVAEAPGYRPDVPPVTLDTEP